MIEKYGGSKGIRDRGLLESAIHRPFSTFDQISLYPFPPDKAATILESILINHPFLDGNWRTAYVLMRMILLEQHLDIRATQEEKYDMVISASKGQMRFAEIKEWIELRLIKVGEY